MKNRILVGLIILCSYSFADQLTPERIYSSPSLSGEALRGVQLAPDGSRVTYLKGKEDDYERLDLWQYNIKSGKNELLFDSNKLHAGNEKLSDEEKARRERMRLSGTGIVSYQWSKDGKALLFPLAGDIYYWQVGKDNARKIVSTPEFETDIKFSPQGNFVSYIREQNLYIFNLKTEKETQLTTEGGGLIKMGMAEFVAQEEMKRMTGYWWSPDETKIALTRVDESPVEEVTRSEIYADEIKMIKQRYPFAGENNVEISLGITSIKKPNIKWVDLGSNKDIYLPRVQWTNNSDRLSFQVQSRDQKSLDLKTVAWPEMKVSQLISEKSKTWINLHDELTFLKNKEGFLWASERDGFKHIYWFDDQGKLKNQLTTGDWVIDEIKYVDEKNNLIYFTGRKDSPLERHLYRVSFNGGKIEKISERSGFHNVKFAYDGSSYTDNFSDANTPPQVSLHSSDGKRLTWLSENKVDKDHPFYPYKQSWIKPEFGNFKTDDGTKLYYRMYKPAEFNPNRKYPALVYLYGGPGVQLVTNRWGRMLPQYMAQQGYVVFTVDNRGSKYRGKAFEDPIYRAMGKIEVNDQIEGVKFLRKHSWIDSNRIGVYGHSYGGYMTLMTMFQAPEYFQAGVSGAPVTDWRLYDTHYTERYMGHPEKDKKAYEESSVFPYATNLSGPLLIYHGMADDNVLFKNSTKLYKLLQDNNIQFYMMDYPGKKHSIRGKQTSMHRLNMIRSFFDSHFDVKRL
ncbi:S9 family peptidase [Pleionea sediminis]|uniref:S9 family peptidase n=1 Tax=Pleionea sediminis TaxID=2569479 RepID=UPI001185F99F|nr:S9 family peptidase [Pleionea sediminis]